MFSNADKDQKLSESKRSGTKQLFVMGSARSGTTLLQRILNSLDGVCIWGEHGGFLKYLVKANNVFRHECVVPYLESLKAKDKQSFCAFEKLKDPRTWSAWSNQFNEDDLKKSFRDFLDSFFGVTRDGLKFYGFKEVRYGYEEGRTEPRPPGEAFNDGVLEFLAEIYDDAKFIFIVRNPLDVVASQVSVFKKSDTKAAVMAARHWAEQNEYLLDFYFRHKQSCFLIRYEDMIDRKKLALTDLASFLGLSLGAAQFAILALETGRGADPRREKRGTLFSREEISGITEIVKSTACKLGYGS